MSVYIAFYSFAVIGILLQIYRVKLKQWGMALVVVIGVIGICDQMSGDLVPTYEENRQKYDEAAQVGNFLNEYCNEGDSIFFLPFQRSNNYAQINGHDRYESYLPSLFTNDLKWALYYGDIERDLWAEAVSYTHLTLPTTSRV